MNYNLDFDETTWRHSPPLQAQWEQEWEENPNVWQNPWEETPYGHENLLEMYQEEFQEPEIETILDSTLRLSVFSQATPEFRDYLRAMLASKHSQMRLVGVEVNRERFDQLPPKAQLRQMATFQGWVQMVYDYLVQQGKDPVPGSSQCPKIVPAQIQARWEQALS